ncbi:YveK family protein [Paenibacillus daejeonensis]|uniref:YveK family protein n=1 Tax=Paenibacillus daejeonensis TaxID=135193 RepID=UPI001469E9A6|nr:Wzz/FepE/Etk N-terminal domain-containing protein [Paenibacillus daejeonensis]
MEIKEYARILFKRLWIIVACVVVATVTTAYYTYSSFQPVYEANTKLIINSTIGQSGNEQIDYGTLTFTRMFLDTYREIISTPAIMEKVVEKHPELRLTANQLIQSVQVITNNTSQVMTLRVYDMSYERAATVVNAVSNVFKEQVPEIMKVDNITILNEAPLIGNPPPVNDTVNRTIAMSFAISLLFGIALCFLLEYLDDTLKTEEDISQVFGVPTLASVVRIRKSDLKHKRQQQQNNNKAGEANYAAIPK